MPNVESEGAELSFEVAIERLEKIVEQMESAKLPLEDLIAHYEEGIRLVAVCNEKLAAAEHRIEMLNREAAQRTAPAENLKPKDPTKAIKDQDHEISLF
ncbi:MAG: exodeoxyribonuclease VII small subunit [Verrucomicrobia bacterium]|nr:exodeoxyribonuclease VII small subunit [Verrucomicrobiota bacterium]